MQELRQPSGSRQMGGILAGAIAGAAGGFAFGGVGGRVVMRVIALIDASTDGAETDFATVGEITLGGSLTLAVLTTLAGIIGGLTYVAVRRWLPSAQPLRGLLFGALMMFGPGVIAVSELDLQIFEPAVPIFAMFVALIVTYGLAVSLLADRLHPPPPVAPGPRMERAGRAVLVLAVAAACVMAVLVTQHVYSEAGTCLSANDTGGCAVRAP